jgi:hypothetical protein
MKHDKFLWAIVGGTLALVSIAVALAVLARLQPQSIADDAPDGVAYNYFLALQKDDVRKAYNYLSMRVKGRVQNPDALLSNTFYRSSENNVRFRVDEVNITGDSARLKVTQFNYFGGGLFGGRAEYSSAETIILVRENGAWKIDRFFYPYWDNSWN